jgi:hypothetical protein
MDASSTRKTDCRHSRWRPRVRRVLDCVRPAQSVEDNQGPHSTPGIGYASVYAMPTSEKFNEMEPTPYREFGNRPTGGPLKILDRERVFRISMGALMQGIVA